MVIRHAEMADLPAMMDMFARARAFMASSGNPNQWVDGYPSAEVAMRDIEARNAYVCTGADGSLLATFCFIVGDDPTYAVIEQGRWLNSRPYATIHRLASSGIEAGMALECLRWAASHGLDLRADTHADNHVMQTLIARAGFGYCGIIRLADGNPRLAYERLPANI